MNLLIFEPPCQSLFICGRRFPQFPRNLKPNFRLYISNRKHRKHANNNPASTQKGRTMNPLTQFKKNPLIAFIAFLFLMGAFTPVYPADKGGRRLTTPIGDIAFEVVGQVTNPSPTTSNQYGYLSLINGLSAEQIFTTANPAAQNETTALFTFFTDAVTERVIANGSLRIINRTGTTTVYIAIKAACRPLLQPQARTIVRRSTAQRPRNTPQPLAFCGTDAKEFPILHLIGG